MNISTNVTTTARPPGDGDLTGAVRTLAVRLPAGIVPERPPTGAPGTIAAERAEASAGDMEIVRTAVTAMHPTQPAWSTPWHPTHAATRSLPATCPCGQELDVCRGNHCPRCGTTLCRAGSLALAG